MNIKRPVSHKPWAEHTAILERETVQVLEEELTAPAWEAKVTQWNLQLQDLGNCTDEELKKKVVDIGVTLDCSWSSRGWSATDALVAAVSVDTGKVVDVVHLNSSCVDCKKMDQRKQEDNISRKDFLEWFIEHEPGCKLNHEGSSVVSLSYSYELVYKAQKTNKQTNQQTNKALVRLSFSLFAIVYQAMNAYISLYHTIHLQSFLDSY